MKNASIEKSESLSSKQKREEKRRRFDKHERAFDSSSFAVLLLHCRMSGRRETRRKEDEKPKEK